MNLFPIFLNLQDRPAVVIGGGDVAERKVSLLMDAGARVTVVAPELTSNLQGWLADGCISHRQGTYEDSDLDGAAIIIAATDDRAVNERVSALGNEKGVPVNVVDNPELCSFITPSIIDRSPVQIAVSTGGSSPVLARCLRSKLETMIPSAYGRLATMLDEFRDQAKQAFATVDERRHFWEEVLAGPIVEMVMSGQDDQARKSIKDAFAEVAAGTEKDKTGEVYLVGAGPGDPDLLTFRALRLMQQADVVVYDRLVSKTILDMCRRDADRVYVGKERDNHALPQEDINELLARLAKEGKRVCRLKGGDPFIFGRGGEEIETLLQHGVPFQVVPAITAASGASSYGGIPLTHRDYSQAVIFATGHLKDGSMNLNWTSLAQPNQTIVFYMGLQGLSVICKELIAHGMPTTMPIALVQKATRPDQKVVTGTLENMPKLVKSAHIKPPTLIIVGEVVKLHEKLHWFTSDEEAGQ